MLKKTVKFIDFDGAERTTVLYFNLVESEIVRLDVEFKGGLENYINNLNAGSDTQDILTLFERVILLAYGEKSEDGLYFLKGPDKSELFKQSAAYNSLFMSIVQDVDVATDFFNRLLSSTVVDTPKKGGTKSIEMR